MPLGQRAAQLADGSTDRTAMRARARTTLRAGRQPRENKHRPSEASSKRPVPVLRESIQGPRAQGKDPRFESLAGGAFDERRFKSQYAFLYDEKLPEERKGLRAALKKAKGAEARADLQARLTRVEQALREENARRWKLDFKAKLKVCDGGLVKGGGAVLLYRGGKKPSGRDFGRGTRPLSSAVRGGKPCGDLFQLQSCHGQIREQAARSGIAASATAFRAATNPPFLPPHWCDRARSGRQYRRARRPSTSRSRSRSDWSWWPSLRSSRPAAGWRSTWRSGGRRMQPRTTDTWWRPGRRPSSFMCAWHAMVRLISVQCKACTLPLAAL